MSATKEHHHDAIEAWQREYELHPQEPRQPVPHCCDGCAIMNDPDLHCRDFAACHEPDNLHKIWKRVETTKQPEQC